jgi:hypothetical protein
VGGAPALKGGSVMSVYRVHFTADPGSYYVVGAAN